MGKPEETLARKNFRELIAISARPVANPKRSLPI